MTFTSKMVQVLTAVLGLCVVYSGQSTAWAAGYAAVPGIIEGESPDQLGTWTVHYQRASGGDLADTINDRLDAEANRLVEQATWDGSTRRPWTFDASGTLSVGVITVSEVFATNYDTAEPHMPVQSVSSVVVDSRDGNPITWKDLFVDDQAGLARLGDATAATLSAAAPPDWVRDWRRQGQFTPLEMNFKAWTPTAQGLELRFPEYQYGGGSKVVTVPWAAVSDLIAPQFLAMTGR